MNAAIRNKSTVAANLSHPTHARVSADTRASLAAIVTPFFSIGQFWLPVCFSSCEGMGAIMETMLQGLVIIGGLTFSLAASLLIEELIFGQIVRVAFARRAESSKQFSEHAQKN